MNTCVICGIKFKPKRHTTGKHCGRRCAWLARGGAEFNARVAQEGREKNRARQVDKGEGKSYRKLYGRHEHRVIAEQMLGRPLQKGEVVHHADGDRRNNNPSNLRVMTQAEHMREHGMGIPGKPLAHRPWEKRGSRV